MTPVDAHPVSTDGELSLVQRNLLTREGYSPYCGNASCAYHWPRTHFIGGQFHCACGWKSDFRPEFIARFQAQWPSR